jgi:hypothetical protein
MIENCCTPRPGRARLPQCHCARRVGECPIEPPPLRVTGSPMPTRPPNMNKPSERIVVFVTPAQKRAISATADGLGISISELMRRAVLAFSATSDQVKAASIVDRLNAPREPDALAQVLTKAARPLRGRRTSPLVPAVSADSEEDADSALSQPSPLAPVSTVDDDTSVTLAEDGLLDEAVDAQQHPALGDTQATPLPSSLIAAHDLGSAAREIAQAVAAQLSAEAAAALSADNAGTMDDEPLQSLSTVPFGRTPD